MAVYATWRHKTHYVNSLTSSVCSIDSFAKSFVREEVTISDRLGDTGKVLINNATCADIGVTNLRVTHLAIRQTYVLTRSLQLRVRIGCYQGIPIRSRCASDYIVFAFVTNSPTITDN